MAVKGPNHQMRTRIRGLTVLFALIGFGLVGVRLLYMQVFISLRADGVIPKPSLEKSTVP